MNSVSIIRSVCRSSNFSSTLKSSRPTSLSIIHSCVLCGSSGGIGLIGKSRVYDSRSLGYSAFISSIKEGVPCDLALTVKFTWTSRSIAFISSNTKRGPCDMTLIFKVDWNPGGIAFSTKLHWASCGIAYIPCAKGTPCCFTFISKANWVPCDNTLISKANWIPCDIAFIKKIRWLGHFSTSTE